MWVRLAVPVVGAALLVSACGSSGPRAKVARAEQAVEDAALEPETSEHAPLELRMARQKLAAAKEAMDDDEDERARRLAEQALVDAQLARAKADAQESRENAGEVRRSIDTVAAEAQRAIDDMEDSR